jgi:integrase
MRHSISVLKSFFGWLYEVDEIPRNPMDRIKPPRRPNPDDLDVTTVSGADVRRLFNACLTWTEFLCLATLAYLGPRRRAASNVRRRDVDLDRGTIRFREKGGKVITNDPGGVRRPAADGDRRRRDRREPRQLRDSDAARPAP